eukprot:180782_1
METTLKTDAEKELKNNVIKELFGYKLYIRFIPYMAIYATVLVMPTVVLPAFGAKWFANCDNSDNNCEYDYESFNFYQSLFMSIRGSISFLFSGFIGAVSDVYGRKIFLLIPAIISTINYSFFTFYVNLWFFWSLTLINAFSASQSALGSMQTAYISDSIKKQHLKTTAYSIVQGIMAFCVIFGAIGGAMIPIDYIWIVIASIHGLTLFYIPLFMKESLQIDKSRKFKWNNPFKPLFYVNANPLILYLSIISLLQQILSTFIPILIIYINDQMSINNESESNVVNMTFFVSLGISAMFCSGILLPTLQIKFGMSNLYLCVIGHGMVIFGLVTFSLISVFATSFKNDLYLIIIIIIGSFLYSFMGYIGSTTKSITAKYINKNEHGIAFGIIQSYKSISVVLTPLIFGWGYNLSKEIEIPSLILYVIAILMFVGAMIVIFPLRKVVNKLEDTKDMLSFNVGDHTKSLLTTDAMLKEEYETFQGE